MEPHRAAHLTRAPIVTLGGAFMVSPYLAAEERRLDLPDHSLYFRGRSAVLGDPPPTTVTALFGLFPGWLIGLMLDKATPAVPAGAAIDAYTRGCAAWGSGELGSVASSAETADLLYRVVDGADLTGLALADGWRQQERPERPAERLAHALMLAREVRGGLHFAALRACGLGVPEAAVADPHTGRDRLLRTGWAPDDADALIARAEARLDLRARWHRAEQLTDEAFGELWRVLAPAGVTRLVDLLTDLPLPVR